MKRKEEFERRYSRRMQTKDYEPGTLVLKRNTKIEKSLNRKVHPRYLGPYQVVRRTKGGSYILQELDGAIDRQGVAAFRLLPYHSRNDRQLQAIMDSEEDDSTSESNPDNE